MKDQPEHTMNTALSRRRFLTGVTATAATGALAISGLNCSKSGGTMKLVKLGRTNMMVSPFLGDRMSDRKMYEIQIAAGVNYWHKIGTWANPAPYDLFRSLDRDSFYCDTTVASLDKDKAIEIFERALEKTGLEYIDGFKVHSQYRSAEDVRTKMGAIQAFEQLKKQGKTRYLMMSQHINTSEVFEAAVESDLFDVIQVPVNPVVPRDYLTKEVFQQKFQQDEYFALIKKAADRGIGITAMKVFMWGPKYWDEIPDLRERIQDFLPDNKSIATALIHFTLSVPGVVAFGNMLNSFEEVQENLEAVGGEFTDLEDRGLKRFSEAAGSYICRLCGACERANPGGVAVSDILRFMGYAIGHNKPDMAKACYRALPKHARVEAARNLASYEKSCPYNLPVEKLLRKAQILLA